MSKSDVAELVYELVSQIPAGRVVTYGDLGKIIGVNPRYIGFILHNNPYEGKVPCHRVVNSRGMVAANFAFGGGDTQQQMLVAEGVVFVNNKLNLSLYRYFL